ncbi:hypothetical protein F5Y08DRAFT_318716 [Xylaria arbuscula]|nr:hypothetical protein F5Y08DRAFT_318716 [Xylaria arbuscula]
MRAPATTPSALSLLFILAFRSREAGLLLDHCSLCNKVVALWNEARAYLKSSYPFSSSLQARILHSPSQFLFLLDHQFSTAQ